MIVVTVKAEGPFFEDKLPAILEDFLEDATWEIGTQAFAEVHGVLNARIQNPTPYYETQVTQERSGAFEDVAQMQSDVTPVVVHDRGVIYGHWLEGDGSRNAPVTSFRGYAAFKTGAAIADGKALAIAEHVLQRYMPRLRGEA